MTYKEMIADYHARMKAENDYIAHHGITGMKWGVKHGPPYPLGSDISTGSSLKTSTDKSGVLAEVAIVTAVYATPVVALYAATAISEGVASAKIKKKEKAMVQNSEKDSETGLYKQKVKCTEEENIKNVNPSYQYQKRGSDTNCVLCSMTYEMRNRGYEVCAKRLPNDVGVGKGFEEQCFKNAKFKSIQKDVGYPTSERMKDPEYMKKFNALAMEAHKGARVEHYNEVMEVMGKEPKNSRGVFYMNWGYYGGHAIAYHVTDKGKVEFMDTQSGKKMSESDMKATLSRSAVTQFQRLDNLEPNLDFLKKNVLYSPAEVKNEDRVNKNRASYYEEKTASAKIDMKKAKEFDDILEKAEAQATGRRKK